jgi:hypothetical protein
MNKDEGTNHVKRRTKMDPQEGLTMNENATAMEDLPATTAEAEPTIEPAVEDAQGTVAAKASAPRCESLEDARRIAAVLLSSVQRNAHLLHAHFGSGAFGQRNEAVTLIFARPLDDRYVFNLADDSAGNHRWWNSRQDWNLAGGEVYRCTRERHWRTHEWCTVVDGALNLFVKAEGLRTDGSVGVVKIRERHGVIDDADARAWLDEWTEKLARDASEEADPAVQLRRELRESDEADRKARDERIAASHRRNVESINQSLRGGSPPQEGSDSQ